MAIAALVGIAVVAAIFIATNSHQKPAISKGINDSFSLPNFSTR